MCSCHFRLSPSRGSAKPPLVHLSAPHHERSRPLLILIFIARDAEDSSSAVCLPRVPAQEDAFERPSPQSDGSKLFFLSRHMWGGRKKKRARFSRRMLRETSAPLVSGIRRRNGHIWRRVVFSHIRTRRALRPRRFSSSLTNTNTKGGTKTRRVQVAAGSRSFNNPSAPPLLPSLSVSPSMTSGTIWPGAAAPADASHLRGAAHCVLIGLRAESFRRKRVSQGAFGKSAGRCAHESASESVQKPGLMHSTGTSAASLPSSFVRGHLACGGATGFHDVGMHTSASATGSALPAADGLDNDPGAGRAPQASAPLAAAVTSSFLVLSSPSLPTLLPYFIMRGNTMAHSLCLTGSFLQ